MNTGRTLAPRTALLLLSTLLLQLRLLRARKRRISPIGPMCFCQSESRLSDTFGEVAVGGGWLYYSR